MATTTKVGTPVTKPAAAKVSSDEEKFTEVMGKVDALIKSDSRKLTADELRSKAEVLAVMANTLVLMNKYNEQKQCLDAITECVNLYTAMKKGEAYAEILDEENPMMAAVKRLTYDSIKASTKTEGEEKIPVTTIIDIQKPIDRAELHRRSKTGIGADPKWIHLEEKVSMLFACNIGEGIGMKPTEIRDSYAMSKIAADIDLGKTPYSKTNLLKNLQKVVDACLGEGFKVTSHDVNYILAIYAKKSRNSLSVACSNLGKFRGYVTDVMHRIVMGKTYGLEYKKIEAAK